MFDKEENITQLIINHSYCNPIAAVIIHIQSYTSHSCFFMHDSPFCNYNYERHYFVSLVCTAVTIAQLGNRCMQKYLTKL